MKKNVYLGTFALALLATACQQDDFMTEQEYAATARTYTAVIEPSADTRSAVTDAGVFSWTAGDAIRVISSDGNAIDDVALTKADDKWTFSLKNVTEPKYATYPQIAKTYTDGNLTVVTLPAEYNNYTGSTNAAMYADLTDVGSSDYNTRTVKFNHLAGVLRIKYEKMPAGFNQLVFTAEKNIAGDFTIDWTTPAEPVIKLADTNGNGKSITFNFVLTDDNTGEKSFYIPLPVGTYDGFSVELKNTEDAGVSSMKTSTKQGQKIERRTLALMPVITEMDYTISVENNKTTYTVYTAAGLQAVNKILTADDVTTEMLSSNITLAKNIDLTKSPKPYDGGKSNWKAIGTEKLINSNYDKNYTGTFDGNDKEIKGLIIDASTPFQGLIGYLGKNGVVKKLTLLNCTIKSSASRVGGIAGESRNGTVEECVIKNSSISAINAEESSGHVGGFVGRNYYGATISSCDLYSSTIQSSTGDYVGGIVGQNFHIIKDSNVRIETTAFSISGRNLIGGIVGNNDRGDKSGDAKISNCHVISPKVGDITISGTGYNNGGLIGSSTLGVVENCSVTNCTITGGSNQAGGLIGFNNGSVLSGCKVIGGVVTGNSRVGGIAGKNGYDTVYNTDATGIIAACFADNVNVIGTLSATDKETPSTESSVGGLVGINVSGKTSGEIVGCYALKCTKGTGKATFTAAANVVGFNSFSDSGRYGSVKNCYYYASDTDESITNVIPVYTSGNNNETLTAGTENSIAWSITEGEGAMQKMNNEISSYSFSTATKYYWTGTYLAPGFSTTKP